MRSRASPSRGFFGGVRTVELAGAGSLHSPLTPPSCFLLQLSRTEGGRKPYTPFSVQRSTISFGQRSSSFRLNKARVMHPNHVRPENPGTCEYIGGSQNGAADGYPNKTRQGFKQCMMQFRSRGTSKREKSSGKAENIGCFSAKHTQPSISFHGEHNRVPLPRRRIISRAPFNPFSSKML